MAIKPFLKVSKSIFSRNIYKNVLWEMASKQFIWSTAQTLVCLLGVTGSLVSSDSKCGIYFRLNSQS